MPQLVDPTLDLFLYDLGESLGQTTADMKKKRDDFKCKLPAEIVSQIEPWVDQEGEYVELLGENKLLGGKRYHSFSEYKYEGYYYPVKLGDSYGLLLDCSPREQTQTCKNLQWVLDLKQFIEQKLQGEAATLGQTWVFYATVENASLEDYETIARNCYHALMSSTSPNDYGWEEDKIGESAFAGGKWFECWYPGHSHVVILLFSKQEVLKKVGDLIQDEMRLFGYRHKITWAYDQSRIFKKELKEEAQKIQKCREMFQNDGDRPLLLKEANTVMSRYLSLLTGLESQGHTIETNLRNYQKRLVTLQRKIVCPDFPVAFKQEVEEKYLPQIRQDHASLSSWLKLIENVVASVQAHEMHRQAHEMHQNVHHIAAVQSKVEWLEVFFASYYAAALAHYISSDFGFTRASYGAWSVAGWAVLAGLLTLVGLQPWGHSQEGKTSRYKWWGLVGIVMIMAVGWFMVGYLCFRGSGGGSH